MAGGVGKPGGSGDRSAHLDSVVRALAVIVASLVVAAGVALITFAGVGIGLTAVETGTFPR